MAEASTLARPYAKAVFAVAQADGSLADWSGRLSALSGAVQDPLVSQWIGHPALGRSALAEVLVENAGAAAGAQMQNLIRLLAEYGRLRLAPAIAAEFETLRAEAEHRVDVDVVSAAPVDAAQQKAFAAAVSKRLAREVKLSWRTDESLIAGAIVTAGDLVIDGSYAAELEQLKQVLTA